MKKPEGNPFIFIEEKTEDGDYFAQCFDSDSYNDTEKYQLRDIEETLYSHLRHYLEQGKTIPIRELKRELIEYKNYFMQECSLSKNSIEKEWLHYWCVLFYKNYLNRLC